MSDTSDVPTAASTDFQVAVTDSRRAMAYLIAPYADEYVAIMAVLESSITDMTPVEVASALRMAGTPLDPRIVGADGLQSHPSVRRPDGT
jgi:hypothetical protein